MLEFLFLEYLEIDKKDSYCILQVWEKIEYVLT